MNWNHFLAKCIGIYLSKGFISIRTIYFNVMALCFEKGNVCERGYSTLTFSFKKVSQLNSTRIFINGNIRREGCVVKSMALVSRNYPLLVLYFK